MSQVLLRRLQGWLTTGSGTQRSVATLVLCVVVGSVIGAVLGLLGPLLGPALLLGLAAGLLLLRSTQLAYIALVATICLLPFGALPVPDVGFQPTVIDLILLALLFNWLFQVALKKRRHILASSLGLPIIAFMILACASFVMGLSYAHLTANLLRHFAELLLNMLLFFIVINTVRKPQHLEQIITVLILAGLAASLIGVVLYFLPQHLTVRLLSTLRVFGYPSGTDVLFFTEDNPELPLRATSTSINPNVLGGMLVIVAALTVSQLLASEPIALFRSKWRRWGINWVAVPVLAAMMVCLLLTYSRGALVGLAGATLALAVIRYRRLLPLMMLAAVVLLLLPQTQWYVQRFFEGIQGQDLATQMRFGEYKDALVLISRYPWFGAGFAAAPDIDVYLGVSNVYLLIAEQMGLVGLALFLAIMAMAIGQTLKALPRLADNPRLEGVLLGLFAALVGALLTGVFDHYFFNINFQHAGSLFWLVTGLSVSTALLATESAGSRIARTASVA